MSSIIKNIFFLPIWVLLIFIFIFSSYNLIIDIYIENYNPYLFFIYGFTVYLLSLIIVNPKKYEFWNTLRHEFLHAVFSLLTFSKTSKLVATNEADEDNRLGYVTHTVSRSGVINFIRAHLISLAPYFIPLFTIAICGLYLLIKPEEAGFIENIFVADYSSSTIMVIIGFIYAYEISRSFAEAKPHQSDFSSVGYLYGMVFIIMLQSFFFLVIIYLLALDLNSTDVLIDVYEKLLELKDFF